MDTELSLKEIQKEWHGSLKAYLIGFFVSLLLTAASFSLVYYSHPKTLNFDSQETKQIEALRPERRTPSPSGKGEEEDQFGKVVASQNSKFEGDYGISAELLSGQTLIYVLIALALLQAICQLLFFLHLGQEAKPRWETFIFCFMLLILLVIVFGSLWIMHDLNDRVMSSMHQQENAK